MLEAVSNAELASFLDVTTGSIGDLASKGRVVRTGRGKYDLKASTRAYIGHLREAAAGRLSTNEDLRAEKIRLTAAQADIAEIAKSVKAGAMVDVAEYEKRWLDEMARLRANLLSLPGKIGTACPQFTQHDILMIDSVLRRMMASIADEAEETVRAYDEANPTPKGLSKRARGRRR